MNKPVILLRDFHGLSILDLLTLARAVAAGSIYAGTGMPNVPVTQADLNALVSDLQKKYDAARSRDSIAVAQQDLAEKLLLRAISNLARFAAPIVYNNAAAIEATGFHASDGETHPAGPLAQLLFTPEALKGGGIRIKLGAKRGADSFTVIIVEASANVVITMSADSTSISGPAIIHTDTHPKMTILGVARRTTYLVYAFASNSAGNSPLSAAMEVTTQ